MLSIQSSEIRKLPLIQPKTADTCKVASRLVQIAKKDDRDFEEQEDPNSINGSVMLLLTELG